MKIKHTMKHFIAAAISCCLCAPAYAAGSNMPWEQPLNQVLQSVEGPVAKIVAVIIMIVTGLTLACIGLFLSQFFLAVRPERLQF